MIYCAFDIETCPLPYAELKPRQRRRYKLEVSKRIGRGMRTGEAACMARSTHPALGWICAIAVVIEDDTGHCLTDNCLVAKTPGEERQLLERFWQLLDHKDVLPPNPKPWKTGTLWVSFNGKSFDVPFIQARTNYRRVKATRKSIFDTKPYAYMPHADLSLLYGGRGINTTGLEDEAELMGLDMAARIDGSQVYRAYLRQDYESIREHCLEDARTTLELLKLAQQSLPLWTNE